ncbi:MAG: tetratricopeptide repeat protein [Kiritimatiellae bacterium]|jgi:tetratricopeptide (TPR) repeat protein|nr:tetratricopeptide repeat protein [Kiritimatiellia bacterium]
MKALCILLLLVWGPIRAEGPFEQARALYDTGEFEQALAVYRSIPGHSAALDYNIGNTLMRLGRQPEAIAHYRRAQWLRPGDPDIQANLERAVTQTGAIVPPLPLYRRWAGILDAAHWQLAFIALCWLGAAFGLARRFSSRLHLAGAWVFPLLLVLLLLFGAGTWASRPDHFFDEGIVLGDSVTARFEPLPDATEHFSLPGGSVVTLVEQNRNWRKIRTEENSGWVPEESVWPLAPQ